MAQWNKPFMKFSDVSPGAIAAFHSATDSIFMHHLMQLHKSQLIHNSTESSKIEPPARLQELFAPDLAAFYQYAVEQHCLKAKRLCHYALENVTSAKIRDIQWYGGAPLCNEGIETGWIVPGINIFKLTGTLRDNAPLQKFNTIGDYANYVRQYIDTNKVLVRISVEVECRGEDFSSRFQLCSCLACFSFQFHTFV